jgi:fatty-acyl-CoA synthase
MGIHLRADPAPVPGVRAMGISGWITCRGRWAPGKTAVSAGNRSVTYGEPGRDIGSAVPSRRAGGIWPGDRLAYRGPDCRELLELLLACARPGAVLPLDAWPPSECGEETR